MIGTEDDVIDILCQEPPDIREVEAAGPDEKLPGKSRVLHYPEDRAEVETVFERLGEHIDRGRRYIDRAKRYHDAIRRILLHEWDPVGVRDVPEAQDEYDHYIGKIYGMLIHHEPRHKLIDYLWSIETDAMGLAGSRQRTEAIADQLLSLRDELETSG